jgi:hypothetical protein
MDAGLMAQVIDNSQSEKRENRVRIVDPPSEEDDKKPKGILKKPTEKFPENADAVREGVAPLKDVCNVSIWKEPKTSADDLTHRHIRKASHQERGGLRSTAAWSTQKHLKRPTSVSKSVKTLSLSFASSPRKRSKSSLTAPATSEVRPTATNHCEVSH